MDTESRISVHEAFENAHEADEDGLALVLALEGVAHAMLDISSSLDALHETVRGIKGVMDTLEANS